MMPLTARHTTKMVLAMITMLASSVQGIFIQSQPAAAKFRVQAAALKLARALRSEVDPTLEFPLLVSVARDLLKRKAELRRAHDLRGAALLDSFAGRQLPFVLYLPTLGGGLADASTTPNRHIVSSKTVCQDGKCKTETVTDHNGKTSKTTTDHLQDELMKSSPEFDTSIDNFLKEMTPVNSDEPAVDMDDALTDMFEHFYPRHRLAPGKHVYDDTEETSLGFPFSEVLKEGNGMEEAEGKDEVLKEGNAKEEAEGKESDALSEHMLRGNMFGDGSFSKSSESHIVNGKRVTTTTTCRGIFCTTEVFTETAPTAKEKVPAAKGIKLVTSFGDTI